MGANKEYIPSQAENKRLSLQNHLLDNFDFDIYAEILRSENAPMAILDVGCNSGDMLVPKLKSFPVKAYIGIDKSEALVAKAVQHYSDESYHFLTLDVESADFEDRLTGIMSLYQISAFSVINISMVLLHLMNPQKLLIILHRVLAENGTVIIRDIDDGLNVAYPDERKLFERIYQIAEADELTGNRFTGRKVFHFLQKAGYRDIQLRRVGLSTAGLSREQKLEFFNMTYKTILDRTEVMYRKYPEDAAYAENYEWAHENSLAIRDLFMQEDFSALMGFMTYTAKHA